MYRRRLLVTGNRRKEVHSLFDLRREAESNISFANSVIGLRRRLRTRDDNDLEHVTNAESSLETGPFATFRPPPNILYIIICEGDL